MWNPFFMQFLGSTPFCRRSETATTTKGKEFEAKHVLRKYGISKSSPRLWIVYVSVIILSLWHFFFGFLEKPYLSVKVSKLSFFYTNFPLGFMLRFFCSLGYKLKFRISSTIKESFKLIFIPFTLPYQGAEYLHCWALNL